jgi:type IV secretory pathway VirB6-like protein
VFALGFETARNRGHKNHKHDGKEKQMEEAKSDQNTSTITVKTRKKRWLDGFVKFLMYGGFMLIIILGFIIYVVISVLVK